VSGLSDQDRGLLERQARRQAAAHRLLDELELLERWRAHGRPVLCGSVAYGLVVAPDIDLEVLGPPDIDAGFALVGRWARDPRVRRVRFTNELDGLNAGLYWQLRVRHQSELWKVDMWMFGPDHPGPRSGDLVEPLRQALDARSRCAILRIKEEALADRGPGAYRSIDVYRAVVDDGVTGLAEFDTWRASHACDGLVRWRPRAAPP
jgi:hypothetical protein